MFADPIRLWLLILPLAILAWYVVLQTQRRKYTARFTSVDLLASVAPKRPGWQRHISALLMLIALLALTVGFAKPFATQKVPKQRGTILLTIDTSGSMAATDVAPSRLQAAEDAARNFVNGLPPGLKVGLVSFDSTVKVLVTPTSDHEPVLAGINSLQIGGATATASAINQGLATIAALPPAADGTKAGAAIVLMSDGSPTVGDAGQSPDASVDTAVAAAKKANVPIDTIAFGTKDGTLNRNGESIPVPADPAAMAKIASGTGGKSFTAKSGAELNSVYNQIRKSVGYDTVRHDVSIWFLFLGLVFALLTAAAGLFWMQRIP